MTFFFLVVGLEAKRELDLGELRERSRLAIPVLAAAGGMIVPIAIYLAFNAGGPGAGGWGPKWPEQVDCGLLVWFVLSWKWGRIADQPGGKPEERVRGVAGSSHARRKQGRQS